MPNIQKDKQFKMKSSFCENIIWVIDIWNLRFICYFVFVIC
jgi:hypothetical protein